MSNYFGQLPPQFNNRYINNGIVSGYQQFVNTNVPFMNNSMLTNNPLFYGSIRDSNFYDRVNMAKLEQTKKIKNISDLKLTNEQLSNYVICPIKVESIDKKEYDQLLNDRESTYITSTKGKENIPKVLKEWWNNRKNTPYKNILKDENYAKEFKKKEDLIVHKITQLDKDKIRLENEYEKLLRLVEMHDGELKILFSASEETKHAKNFEYINKYKNRIKYDPKNYDELKQIYKKTQRKIKRENKRIDDMIELLLVSDQISKEDLEEIQTSTNIDTHEDDDIDMEVVFKEGEKKLEKQLEKQLEKELKKELGKDVYNELMKEMEHEEEPEEQEIKITNKPKREVKEIKKQKNNEPEENPTEELRRKPKVKVTKISNDKNESKGSNESNENTKNKQTKSTIGSVKDDEMEKYRNRK